MEHSLRAACHRLWHWRRGLFAIPPDPLPSLLGLVVCRLDGPVFLGRGEDAVALDPYTAAVDVAGGYYDRTAD